jgi:hypothetical protein
MLIVHFRSPGLTSSAYRKLALADLGRVHEPETRESSFPSLDWDALFAPVDPSQPIPSSQTFWTEKLREESARESQEDQHTCQADADPITFSVQEEAAVQEHARPEYQDENAPSCKKRKVAETPPTSPLSVKARGQGRSSPPVSPVRPKLKALGSVSNIIAVRDAAELQTPPPTSPTARTRARCASQSISTRAGDEHVSARSPRKAARPDDSAVCLSPSIPISTSSPLNKSKHLLHEQRRRASAGPAVETLADLFRSSPVFLQAGLETAFPSSHDRPSSFSPINRLSEISRRVSRDQPTLELFLDEPSEEGRKSKRVVIVNPDRIAATQEVLRQVEAMGVRRSEVVVLNVWCLRARTRVREDDWRRWVVHG